MNRIIAVCAACAEDLKELVAAGRELANRIKAPLVLLLIQSPKLSKAEPLETAMQVARQYDAELHVHYSEDAQRTICDFLDEWLPLSVITRKKPSLEARYVAQYSMT